MEHSSVQNTIKRLKALELIKKPNNLFDFILIGFITAELQVFGKKKEMEKTHVKQHLKPAQMKEILISAPLSHHKRITDFKTEVVWISHAKLCIYHIENIY